MTVSARNVLVTGANRGLGREIARILLAAGDTVALGARTDAAAAQCHELIHDEGGRGFVVRLDYADPHSIAGAAATCRDRWDHLDLLVNCGAANVAAHRPPPASKGPLPELDHSALVSLLAINVAGPVCLCVELLALLERSPRACVINMSTARASVTAPSGNSFSYSVSKAALNMATRKMAAELEGSGIAVVAVDPGWMRTRMGGDAAPVDPDVVAHRLLSRIAADGRRFNGRFVTADGTDVPW